MSTKFGKVGLIGRPNVGKSSLLNAMIGQKISIVSAKPQTTRDQIMGFFTKDSIQIAFLDTPGFFETISPTVLDQYMRKQIESALEQVDLVWYVVDPGFDVSLEIPFIEAIRHQKTPILVVANKADMTDAWKKAQLDFQEVFSFAPSVFVSAKHKANLDQLWSQTASFMPDGPFWCEDPDQLSDRPTRFFAQEMIREKLYLKLAHELPYVSAVQVESFQESESIIRIEAVIYVARDSQKAILIGKNGSKIKEIGSLARVDLESFLGQKVFLGLHVKIKKNWFKEDHAFQQMGYSFS